jgi:outer membrane protein assembly factor BamB
MAGAWATLVGGPCHLCNAASTATDAAGHVYGVSAPGGIAFGLDNTGAKVWDDPIGDGSHYESTSTADGVVYTLDNAGFLDVFNAATGALITRRPLAADTGQPMVALSSAGVSIARHLGVGGGQRRSGGQRGCHHLSALAAAGPRRRHLRHRLRHLTRRSDGTGLDPLGGVHTSAGARSCGCRCAFTSAANSECAFG